jgi:cytochrome c biogenesis protein CcmG/thiol:disulfide interchange protein DsbE
MARRWLLIAPPLAFAAFVAMAFAGMFRDDPNALPSARAGQPAPPVVLTPWATRPRSTTRPCATVRSSW